MAIVVPLKTLQLLKSPVISNFQIIAPERIEWNERLNIRLTAPLNYFLRPFVAGRYRLVADENVDLLSFRRFARKNVHHAPDLRLFARNLESEKPGAAQQRVPAMISSLVECQRLKAAVGIGQCYAEFFVFCDDILLILNRQRR